MLIASLRLNWLSIAINTKHRFWIKDLQYKDIPMKQMIAKFDNRPGFGK